MGANILQTKALKIRLSSVRADEIMGVIDIEHSVPAPEQAEVALNLFQALIQSRCDRLAASAALMYAGELGMGSVESFQILTRET
jgi:hypothetical protein